MQVCVVGHFAGNFEQYDGQTVKTQEIYNQLVRVYGRCNVGVINTFGWKGHPIKILKDCVDVAKKVSDVVILPAHKGVKVFVPLFVRLKKKRKFRLHYIVIGGWLGELVKKHRWLKNDLEDVDYIYVENHNLINELNRHNIKHTYFMPNFKNLERSGLKKEKVGNDVRCCIFSRIEKEKGILDAVEAVSRYNRLGDSKVHLDIYGKIKPDFKKEFNKVISGNDYIKYKGVVRFSKSVSVIEQYDMLLFPTRYKTEGIPGTIIDAYFAGVPVLAARWNNFDEIVIENKTGFGYELGNTDDLYDKIVEILSNKSLLLKMRENCLKMALKYTPGDAIRVLTNNIGELR